MPFQTPGGPAAKRRRIDAANATLRKPFRSPLISRQQTETGVADGAQDSPSTQRVPATPVPARSSRPAAGAITTTTIPTAPSPLSTSSSLFTTAASTPPQPRRSVVANPASRSTRGGLNPTPGRSSSSSSRSLPARTPRSSIIKPTTTTPNKPRSRSKPNNHRGGQEEQDDDDDDDGDDNDDDLHTQILASHRTLATHLRTTQQALELVRQARRIEEASSRSLSRPRSRTRSGKLDGGEAEGREEGGNDAGLGAMVAKWKGASRLAAEELFGLVRGRVDGMGGARAWRESRRPRGWDDGGGFGEGGRGRGDGDGDGEGDGDVRGEGCEGEEGEEEKEEEESGETEFTMVMMLKSLNIEPDILGYDPVEDRWRD